MPLKFTLNTKIPILLILSYLAILLFSGCANQKPPGGGEEDKTPPKLVFLSPENNSLNFKGNSLTVVFDEYVDKRSFQEAFHISPPFAGDISFDWSGKEVEIVFEEPLSRKNPDKTFVVSINSTLTDVRGNNLTSPILFAFSTGSKIDKAAVTGMVYNHGEKPISILAYKLETPADDFDPSKKLADYITETSADGSYNLTNLAPGKYRIIAVQDDDKNLLYTSERENFGVLPEDLIIEDSAKIKGINLLMKKTGLSQAADAVDISEFFKDTLGIVYSSIENNSGTVLPDQSIIIFFNSSKPSRDEFVNSFILKDENNKPEKVVYNWKNDSLVEIISPGKFASNTNYEINIQLNILKDSVYNYVLKFRTVSLNSFGEIKGSIRRTAEPGFESMPVYIELNSLELKPKIRYSISVNDSLFTFENVFEADYTLFSFVDRNFNEVYDYGNPFPFEFAEQFFFYPQSVSAKGGWAVENVNINFK